MAEVDESVRTLRMRPESWSLFLGWVQSLSEAEAWGEEVPDVQDLDATVQWLLDRHELEPPVGPTEARIIIEACLKGGMTQVRRI
jgi:hypothetical protein